MEKNNKSRIPQLTDSKLKLQANLDQKKTEPITPNVKGNSGQKVPAISRLKPPSNFSNNKPQTIKRTSKFGRGLKGQEEKQTTSTITKTPNYTRRKWVSSSRNSNTNRAKGNVKATFVRHAVLATKPAVKNTMTVQDKTKQIIKRPAPILGRARDDGQQKKLEMSSKRKNEVATVGRNVRRKALAIHDLDNLRDQNDHLKASLSAAQTTKAVAIANKTSLEFEKERLKRERNTQFLEACHLEHDLACEQSKVADLLDQIAKQRSDYLLMAQEKDNLLKNRIDLEEKNNKIDQELDELANLLAISGAELKEVTTHLDKKLHVNSDLKSSVNQLRARLDNSKLSVPASLY